MLVFIAMCAVFWLFWFKSYQYLPSDWLERLVCAPVSEMTYTVSTGTLNSTIPYHQKKRRLRDRTDRAWFSRLLRHPAMKRSRSILTTLVLRRNKQKCLLEMVWWGTDITGLMRGMATLPQGNRELLVVWDKVGGSGSSSSSGSSVF